MAKIAEPKYEIHKEPIYVYELDKVFDSPLDLAIAFKTDEELVLSTLRHYQDTYLGMHLAIDRKLKRSKWRPVRILETGETFLSSAHVAYHFYVTQGAITNALRTWDKHFRNYHLEYVQE